MKEISPASHKVTSTLFFPFCNLFNFFPLIDHPDSAGKSEKSFQLLVYQRPFIRSFRNETFDQFKRSYLECRAIGNPTPKMTIRRNGLTRAFIAGDQGVLLEEKMEFDEKVLTLIYLNTVVNEFDLIVNTLI